MPLSIWVSIINWMTWPQEHAALSLAEDGVFLPQQDQGGITISSPCTFNLIWNRSKDVLINSIEKEFYKLKPVLCTHSIHSNEKFRSSSYKLTVNNPTRSWDFQIPLSPVCERNRNPNRKIRKPHWKPNPKPIRPKTIC